MVKLSPLDSVDLGKDFFKKSYRTALHVALCLFNNMSKGHSQLSIRLLTLAQVMISGSQD